MSTHPPDPSRTDPSAADRAQPAADATRGAVRTSRSAPELLAELDGLHQLAVRAEDLARVVGIHGGHDALDDHQLSALEQARSNAAAIVASLDRAR